MCILTFWSNYPHFSRESRNRRVDCAFKQPRHNSNLLNQHHAPRTRTCLCQTRAPKFAPPSFNLVPLLWSGSTTQKNRLLLELISLFSQIRRSVVGLSYKPEKQTRPKTSQFRDWAKIKILVLHFILQCEDHTALHWPISMHQYIQYMIGAWLGSNSGILLFLRVTLLPDHLPTLVCYLISF